MLDCWHLNHNGIRCFKYNLWMGFVPPAFTSWENMFVGGKCDIITIVFCLFLNCKLCTLLSFKMVQPLSLSLWISLEFCCTDTGAVIVTQLPWPLLRSVSLPCCAWSWAQIMAGLPCDCASFLPTVFSTLPWVKRERICMWRSELILLPPAY